MDFVGTDFQPHEDLIKTTLIEAFTNHQDVSSLIRFIYDRLKSILPKSFIFVKETKRGNSNRIKFGNYDSIIKPLIELNVKKKFNRYFIGLFFIFSHIRNYIFWSNENNSMFLQPNWSIEVFFKKCFNSHKFCLCIHFNISIIEPISDF